MNIPVEDGELVCMGCCQGTTKLEVDTAFTTEDKLRLLCPACGSNWSFISERNAKIQSEEKYLATIEELEKSNQLLSDNLLRAKADYQNMHRRSQQERLDSVRYGTSNLLKNLLPTLDNLHRTVQVFDKSTGETSLIIDGIAMIVDSLELELEQNGLKPIDALYLRFDPNIHQALSEIPSDQYERGIIVEEVQRGYMIHDRILRPSKVIVSSGPTTELVETIFSDQENKNESNQENH